jgi:5-methylcytosine-specific restriction enzyme B
MVTPHRTRYYQERRLATASAYEWNAALLDDLHRVHSEMSERGELKSRDVLAGYYATFRERFGPDVLRAIDGERLLSLLHETAPDGMVYWLEFKNDDEFPAIFGSIAGGSALKYGFYRRQGTGEWMTGTPQSQRVLTTAEAIDLARRDRDQLLEASRLVGMLSTEANEADYAALQAALAQAAPDVQDTAWGHKYLSLIHPDKLDDYHALAYQRFHLIKALQKPSDVDGRYVNAPLFMDLSRALDWPTSHVTSVLNRRNGPPHRYWRIGTRDDDGVSYWDRMRHESVAAIGWPELGDLYRLDPEDFKSALRILMAETYGKSPQQTGRSTQQVAHFCRTIVEGDYVVAADGLKVLGIGRADGQYRHTPGEAFPHVRSVDWLNLDEWRLPQAEGLQTTVHELRRFPENLIAIERRILEAPPLPHVQERARRQKEVDDFFFKKSESGPKPSSRQAVWPAGGTIGRIQDLLNRKGQAILYGPPGTGKTYWAELATTSLAALWNFGVTPDQLSPEQFARVDGTNPDGYVRVCTFHPGYGYEDFIEGYRPALANGGALQFVLKDGLFKSLCAAAARDPEGRYYLIVDEINRGDIPRIFGELLTLLDAPKRGTSAALPLSGQSWTVPKNVFVIGTMNTADRSIALLDAALRRRFGFVELMPDPLTLGDALIEGIALGPWLAALNQLITTHVGRDGRNLQVGHSYLMAAGRPLHDFKQLARVLHEDVLPLLQEYCYENWDTLEHILGSGLVDAAKFRFRTELFEPHRQAELIQAVLAFAPEVSASPTAVAADVATASAEEEEEAEDSAEGEAAS